MSGDLDTALQAWLNRVRGLDAFNGVSVAGEPRVSRTEKWRYWRANLTDGGKLDVNISRKGECKAALRVDHVNVADRAAVGAWRIFWKGFLGAL